MPGRFWRRRSGSGLPSVLRSDNGPPFGSVGAGPVAVCGEGGEGGCVAGADRSGPAAAEWTPGASAWDGGSGDDLASGLELAGAGPALRHLPAGLQRERPHEALGQTPPADHYECSPRRYSGRLREPEYGADHEVRRGITAVRSVGGATASTSAPGERAGGTGREGRGDWDIHFGPVPLGRIDRKGRFHRPKRKRRRRKPVREKCYPCRRSKVLPI